ncbi:MAG: META domain-containing protein [Pseudomonadota bacterium]
MKVRWVAAMALALAAYATAAVAQPQGEWRLTAIDGTPAPSNSHAVLRLDDARASGSGGCNAFGADVTRVADQLVFSHIISTMMACRGSAGEDVMGEEHAFLGALRAPLRVAEHGDTMVLSAPDGRTLQFQRVAMTN